MSMRFSPDEPNPMAPPIIGADRTVPEYQAKTGVPVNPYHVDVYCMGNFIRQKFLNVGLHAGLIVENELTFNMTSGTHWI